MVVCCGQPPKMDVHETAMPMESVDLIDRCHVYPTRQPERGAVQKNQYQVTVGFQIHLPLIRHEQDDLICIDDWTIVMLMVRPTHIYDVVSYATPTPTLDPSLLLPTFTQ